MPNFDTINEALKNLNLNEGFDTAKLHYNYNHGAENVDENGKPYHGHAAKNISEFQEAIRNRDMVYLFPNIEQYIAAAKELADAPTADVNTTTTKRGVVAFAGTKNVEWGADFTYKIRFKSKYISKEHLSNIFGGNTFMANMTFDAYKKTFNTDQFCDVLIFKNDRYQHTTDKTIITFYLSTLGRVEKLISACNVYNDERATAETNVKNQLLILQNPCVKDTLEFIVVKPTSISSSNKDRGNGSENYTRYNAGVFYSPAKSEFVSFNLDDEINKGLKTADDKTYAQSSKNTATAKDTFELAAAKKIFNVEYTGSDNFRQRYVKDLISAWVSDLDSATNFIYKESLVKDYLAKKLGIREEDDYDKYHSTLLKIQRNIVSQWNKIIDYK